MQAISDELIRAGIAAQLRTGGLTISYGLVDRINQLAQQRDKLILAEAHAVRERATEIEKRFSAEARIAVFESAQRDAERARSEKADGDKQASHEAYTKAVQEGNDLKAELARKHAAYIEARTERDRLLGERGKEAMQRADELISVYAERDKLKERCARDDAGVIIHQCPPNGSGIMPCCGKAPFEAMADRMTLNPTFVNCDRARIYTRLADLERWREQAGPVVEAVAIFQDCACKIPSECEHLKKVLTMSIPEPPKVMP